MRNEGLEFINEKFTEYANRFKGGDMLNNRYILLNNILHGINTDDVHSESPDLKKEKQEIAKLIKNFYF